MFMIRAARVGAVIRRTVVPACALLTVACGGDTPKEEETPEPATNALEAMGQLATAGSKMENAADAAVKFQQERKARGDTVSMSYTELQGYLPDAPSGYSKAEEPGGSMQSMGSFSMTEADQTYVGEANADGQQARIRVKLVDFGGTEGAYAMFALPMMMNIRQEDAHRRMGTIQLGPENTWASEEFNKDNKDYKVTAMTRYRYMITVEADNQTDDQSDMVRKLMEKIVRRFDGK